MSFLDKTGLAYLWTKIENAVNTALATKVDAVSGKGLSTEDYTTTEKEKLAGIAEGATKITVDTSLSSSSTNPVQNKVVNEAISALETLVGDEKVSDAINDAISNIEVPVQSVNGKTGAVALTASDVGALPDTTEIPAQNVFTARTTSNSSKITATCDGFTYTPGNILILACDNEISTSGYRTLNVNDLGAKNIYICSTDATFASLYGYSGVIRADDTLLLMYDQYDHFVVISHFGKEIMYEDLESGITERLGPFSSSAEVGQFVRLSEDGYWAAETVEIPSIDGLATETYVDEAVAAMVDSAPETLNTLNELAAALGDDPNFATTVATQIGTLESKVGDTSVSEQIDTAIEELEFTDIQIVNWADGDTSSSAGTTTESGESVVYIGNDINKIPSLSATQKAQIAALMDDYMNNKSLFTYNGTYRRESYAYANTSDGSNINGCVEADTGKYFLNCGLFAQMIWMGRAISDYTTTPTTAITKEFDWGYYFDFIEAKRAYGVTRADGSYYGHNTFVNDAGTTKFLSLDGAAVMAKELFRKGYEIPYSDVEVGDLVFYRKRNISDGSEDDFEQAAFRYISHVGIVYSVDPVYGPMIYESTDAFTSGMGKFGLGDDASAYGNVRAVDLETRVCMAARHPAAWGNGGNVPSNFEVYRSTEVQS